MNNVINQAGKLGDRYLTGRTGRGALVGQSIGVLERLVSQGMNVYKDVKMAQTELSSARPESWAAIDTPEVERLVAGISAAVEDVNNIQADGSDGVSVAHKFTSLEGIKAVIDNFVGAGKVSKPVSDALKAFNDAYVAKKQELTPAQSFTSVRSARSVATAGTTASALSRPGSRRQRDI